MLSPFKTTDFRLDQKISNTPQNWIDSHFNDIILQWAEIVVQKSTYFRLLFFFFSFSRWNDIVKTYTCTSPKYQASRFVISFNITLGDILFMRKKKKSCLIFGTFEIPFKRSYFFVVVVVVVVCCQHRKNLCFWWWQLQVVCFSLCSTCFPTAYFYLSSLLNRKKEKTDGKWREKRTREKNKKNK